MATPVVPSTNIGIYSSLRVATDCTDAPSDSGFSGYSLASLCSGGSYNGIQNNFGPGGGPAYLFDVGLGEYLTLEDPPFEMSTTIGGGYS